MVYCGPRVNIPAAHMDILLYTYIIHIHTMQHDAAAPPTDRAPLSPPSPLSLLSQTDAGDNASCVVRRATVGGCIFLSSRSPKGLTASQHWCLGLTCACAWQSIDSLLPLHFPSRHYQLWSVPLQCPISVVSENVSSIQIRGGMRNDPARHTLQTGGGI